MTALAGRWNFDGRPDVDRDCERMLAVQAMYGPHDRRSWSDGAVALGRALYRLLPEDRFDRQPLIGADGVSALVADLRIDNREELIAALDIAPAAAAGQCDAQILLAALERWDEGALDRVLGDFAFAWWRPSAGKLLLARDAIGQRPLHYHAGDGFFAFATMPKGLHALADIPYAPDEVRIAELLALIPEMGPRSFFAGISRVEPGHVVTMTGAGASARRYWNPRPLRQIKMSMEQATEGLRSALDRAVSVRLRGAGDRVASHLSAGYDSGAVTATAARLTAGTGRVVAFTSVPRSGYDGPDPKERIGDEGPLAAQTAAMHPNVEHVLMPTTPGTPFDGLDRDFALFERPILNLCNQRWYVAIAAEAKRRGLTVLLAGQMGNMTISYNGLEHLPDLVARGRLLAAAKLMRGLVRHKQMRWTGAMAAAFGRWVPVPLWHRLNRIRGRESASLDGYSAIRRQRYDELGLAAVAEARGLDPDYRPRADPVGSRLWVLGRFDPGNYTKGMLAGWGLDIRDPTADRRLVEYCLSVPDRLWIEGGEQRSLAKRTLADRLPAAVLEERRKGLQAVDWHEGVVAGADELKVELERLANVAPVGETLDIEALQALVNAMPEGEWHRAGTRDAYRLRLLRGVASGHFLRKATRSNA